MFYHVSPTGGLRMLEPRVSSHGRAYVYAVNDPVIGLLFGAPHDDLDFLLDVDERGQPVLYECYPQAVKRIYTTKRCSLYEVSEVGFQRGKTGWDAELVCEYPVKVQRETVVPDLLQRLLEEEARHRLTIHRYENSQPYKKMISEHVIDRMIRFRLLDTSDWRVEAYYSRLVEGLKTVMDGHLL